MDEQKLDLINNRSLITFNREGGEVLKNRINLTEKKRRGRGSSPVRTQGMSNIHE